MCPKNLRTRLRPVNVCCAIVASRCVALQVSEPSREHLHRPPDEFRSSSSVRSLGFRAKVLNLFFGPSKRKATCGAQRRTRPSQPSASRTAKARNCLFSQRLAEKRRRSRLPRFRAAVPIWDGKREDSRGKPTNPRTFLCSTPFGPPRSTSFAKRPGAVTAGPRFIVPPLRRSRQPSFARVRT
jgi:hypothetical protein